MKMCMFGKLNLCILLATASLGVSVSAFTHPALRLVLPKHKQQAAGEHASAALRSSPASLEPAGGSSGSPRAASWDVYSINGRPMRIEGKSRRSWPFTDITKEVVQCVLQTEGRPMNCDIELWIGPDWTPLTLKAYSENGKTYPVQTLVGTRNKNAEVEIRNVGSSEMPVTAACSYATGALATLRETIAESMEGRYIEGGAVYSVPFGSDVDQIQILLKTDTMQLNARVEILNGPNNKKQEFEVFTNNGMLNSLYVLCNTPAGGSHTVRITNIAPLEFPCRAYVVPAQ